MIKAKRMHRIAAFLLDGLITAIILFVILLLTSSANIFTLFWTGSTVITLYALINFFQSVVVIVIALCIYYVVLPAYFNGQTIGKRLFGIKIVKKDGSDVDFVTLFVREMVGQIFLGYTTLGLTLIISSLLMGKRDDIRGIHDILADTKVIDITSK